jgi:hypothetical protein
MKMFFLIDAIETIHELHLSTSLTIGRGADSNIVLDDRMVSREHARITVTQKGPIVTDRKSANGVSVNGIRVEAQILKHGDAIQIGKYVLYIFEGARADAEAWIKKRAASRTDQTIVELNVAHPTPSDLIGDISTLQLVPLLQNLIENRQRGRLELKQYGMAAGTLWVDNGAIIHAETPKPQQGKPALFELMGLEYAQFVFHADAPAPCVSITDQSAELLTHCQRLVDERRRPPGLPS